MGLSAINLYLGMRWGQNTPEDFVHYVRQDATWGYLRRTYNLLIAEPIPTISIVTAGELRSLAIQNRWGERKLDQMEFALGYFQELALQSPKLVRAYATIDSTMAARGHFLGKNDLWIAAAAAVTGATLLTTDGDFDPLAPDFLTRLRVPVQLPADPPHPPSPESPP